MTTQGLSDTILRRFPMYLHYLKGLKKKGQEQVSASQMSRDLGVHHTQIRKDIAETGVRGVPKVGHNVAEVINAIETFLNWNNVTEAFLVGAGNLGSSLIKYAGLRDTGIKVTAAFDTDEAKIGTEINGVEVLPVSKLGDLTRRMHVNIGIITAPAAAAQEIADVMTENGIRAIWNFAPVKLRLPDDVIVEDMDIYSSFAVLSRKLARSIKD